MRKEVKEITVYTFDELSEDIQTRVLDNFRDETDDIFEDNAYFFICNSLLHDLRNDYGINVNFSDVNYSGFNSQGDGLRFEFEISNNLIVKYIEKEGLGDKCKLLYETLQSEKINDLIIRTEKNGSYNLYCHEHTLYMDYEIHFDEDEMNVVQNRLDFENTLFSELNYLLNYMNDWRISLCKKMYKELEYEYEYLLSYEYIREHISANYYEFTADGKIY
jgi:hypothetical protein